MKKILSIFTIVLYAQTAFSQINPIWTNRYDGVGDFSDKFNAITLDATENIYITGSTMITGNSTDVITAKLKSNGDTIWVRTFDYNNSGDKGNAIKVDPLGNVYVVGTIDGITGKDIFTVKYNSIGDTLWTRTYNNILVNQDEAGVALAIDTSGNVYVSGNSDNDPSAGINDDYVTIKYSSSGVTQWTQTYNGSGNLGDIPVGVGVDNNGNVYIAGKSFNGSDDDYATIKYNSTGTQLWLQTYDGGANDRAAAMQTDALGNTYVTGRSKSANDNFYTIAYNASGTALWNATYDGTGAGNDRPLALTFDVNGNVYVTGQSDVDITTAINYDYLTVKYDLSGTEMWATNYNGPGNNNDIPSDIAVDPNGNVFVTGKTDADAGIIVNNDYATVRYNLSGIQQWVKTYIGTSNLSDAPNAIAVDSSGNSVVTGSSIENNSQKDGTTIKYDLTGTQQWINKYNGIGDNSDNGSVIAADASGNIYVAGYTSGNSIERDLCVMKINSIGDTSWVRKYDGGASKTDQVNAIAVDVIGNVYVTGYAKNILTGYDYITIKYNSVGDTVWTKTYNGIGNGTDKASGLFVDDVGNVYITGYSDSDPSIASNDNYLTVKYDSSGAQQWASFYNGTTNGSDRAIGIVVDANSNVYVTGKSFNGTNYDIITVKYNSSGIQQNFATYSGGNGDDIPNAIAIDANANIYLTGQSAATNLFDDCTTLKYNSSLSQIWVQTFNGIGDKNDRGNAIVVDGTGNVYVTGQSDSSAALLIKNYDYVTIKYNSAGTQQWEKVYNGQSNTNDAAAAIAIDGSGNVYVTGQSENGISTSPNKDYVTIKYNSSGAPVWTSTYNGTGNGPDGANAIIVVGSYVYVTGGSWGINSQKDILSLKYDTMPLGISSIKNQCTSIKVFPNPFQNTTTISVMLLNDANIFSFELYNLQGQKLDVSHSIIKTNKNVEIKLFRNNLPSGVYFYKLDSENNLTDSGKIIIE